VHTQERLVNAGARPLDATEEQTLLAVAARAVHDALASGRGTLPDATRFNERLRQPGATFVTLERGDQLLGCIGTLEPVRPLVVDVARNALAAAFADPRLPPVTPDDYAAMSIKISVLSQPEPLAVSNFAELAMCVRPGVDGLLLEAGQHRSTLLPSVWPKVDGVNEFLAVLWQKAGLRGVEWEPSTRVSRYTTHEFCDPGPRESLTVVARRSTA
jgi:AmmeMemoRadiSam system protein A